MFDTETQALVGPIQLVVVGFPPDAQFRGEIIRALSDVRGRGVVRLIDALFVRKDAKGNVSAMMRDSDLTPEQRGAVGSAVAGLLGLAADGEEGVEQCAREAALADNAFGLGIADLQNVKGRIQPGAAALLLLIEHQWATELKAAVRRAGGVPLVQGLLTPEAVFMVGAELRAVLDAEDTIALAEAAKGAAQLSALATIAEAERVQQAAVAETARVLMAAGLIEEAAAQEVLDTLVAAELLERAAVAEAEAVVARARQEVDAMKAAQATTNGHVVAASPPS